MSIIKFIGKLLLSKYQDDQDLEKISAKPKSNMIATTTIINQKKISRVIHSYSALDHPLIRIHKNTSKRPKARFIPIAESSAISTKTMCNSCLTKKKSKKYCKCCGKTVRPSATKKCVIWIEDNQSYYRHKQIISSGRNDKFKNVDVRNRKLKSCLKKSKAMTNIKQIEYKSFLSNKRKYSSTLSSTWQDNIDSDSKRKKHSKKKDLPINSGDFEKKINGTFVVDFASTPIKLAPKTSTPVKIRKF